MTFEDGYVVYNYLMKNHQNQAEEMSETRSKLLLVLYPNGYVLEVWKENSAFWIHIGLAEEWDNTIFRTQVAILPEVMEQLKLGISLLKHQLKEDFSKKEQTYKVHLWNGDTLFPCFEEQTVLAHNEKEAIREVHKYSKKRDGYDCFVIDCYLIPENAP